MKVVHIFNVANIAYLNTKFLRRKGIDADVYVYDYGMSCVSFPEWEEGDFDPSLVSLSNPDWSKVPIRNGWERPPWVKSAPPPTWHRLPYARVDPFIEQMEWRLNEALKRRQHRIVNESLRRRGLPELDFAQASQYFDIYRWEKMVAGYDIVVAYGTEPISCLVDYPEKNYIAVDYGSPLRVMISGESGPYDSRLLQASYERADCVVLTNPDTCKIADRLGLRYVFIPHPVDEEKFCPGPSKVRAELEERYGEDVVVLFAPARHDWAVKGNDKMLRAVARLMREERRPVVLILTTWGQEVGKSKALIHQEGIEGRVVWLPLLPKVRMVEYYRAADIVLDQFNIGTFGLATPEAMACGKPVVLHFNPKIHEWCFPELPPVVRAYTEQEICEETAKLVRDVELREAIGHKSRDWFTRYHGWEHVASLHIMLYQKLLSKSRSSQ